MYIYPDLRIFRLFFGKSENNFLHQSIYQKRCVLILFAFLPLAGIHAQMEEIKQKVGAFEELLKEEYVKKTFNIADKDLGDIAKTDPVEILDIMYKSKEKKRNQYDNMGFEQLFISVYLYEDEFKKEVAMEWWFKNFIRGLSIKPGKNIKFYDGAQPTLIMINSDHIIILQAKCKFYSEDSWYLWKKSFIKAFEETGSSLIEIKCDGPLEWGLTIPELKKKK